MAKHIRYYFFHRNKPYDSKKSVWMTDGEGGFIEGLLQSDDGKKAVVMVGHEVYFKSRNCFPRNIETCYHYNYLAIKD